VTFYRSDPNAISNYFERLMKGCGPRPLATFTNIDACTHDRDTHRYLFQEFKQPHEALNRGGVWPCLRDLARPDYVTVWCVRKLGDGPQGNGRLEFFEVANRHHDFITTDEYRDRVRRWWRRQLVLTPGPEELDEPAPALIVEPSSRMLTAKDIRW
jgi:hypothetical protein